MGQTCSCDTDGITDTPGGQMQAREWHCSLESEKANACLTVPLYTYTNGWRCSWWMTATGGQRGWSARATERPPPPGLSEGPRAQEGADVKVIQLYWELERLRMSQLRHKATELGVAGGIIRLSL